MKSPYSTPVRIIGIVLCIGSLIGAIVLAIALKSFWYFLLVAVSAAVMLVFSLSYAQLLDDTALGVSMLVRLEKRLQATPESQSTVRVSAPARASAPFSTTSAAPANAQESAQAEPKEVMKNEADDHVAPIEIDLKTGKCTCPRCGQRQNSGRQRCLNCGVKFDLY